MSQMIDPSIVVTRRENGTLDVATDCSVVPEGENPNPTQQQFKDECDVNVIIARYQKVGMPLPDPKGFYADFVGLGDYREMLHTVASAQESFLKLAPEVRRRFDNDPGKLLTFLNDPKNLDEAVSLGLCEKPALKPSLNNDSNDDGLASSAGKTKTKKPASQDSAGSAGE